MADTTATVLNGQVIDVETWTTFDLADALRHPRGGTRILCPDYVTPGDRYDGTNWLRFDGSPYDQATLDRSAERSDLTDIQDRLKAFRKSADFAALATPTGTNVERIARLEKAVRILIRTTLKLMP